MLPRWRAVLPAALAVIVCWELFFPVALIVPRLRRVWLPLGLLFHLSTRILLNVAFWNQMAMYLVFVDWPRVGHAIAARWPGPAGRIRYALLVPESFPAAGVETVSGEGILLWDGACGFCARMVEWLQRHLPSSVRAMPFQEYQRVPPGVQAWTGRQMHWVAADGSMSGGSTALVAVLRAGGRPWLAAFLDSGLVRPLTWIGYRLVAANRGRIGLRPAGACRVVT